MKREIIDIQYPGSVISVNHYRYHGGYHLKTEALDFMDELGWLVKIRHIEDWVLPINVTCHGKFTDNRSVPDLSNLSKICLDTIQNVTGINDRHMRWHDGESRVVQGCQPMLKIVLEES